MSSEALAQRSEFTPEFTQHLGVSAWSYGGLSLLSYPADGLNNGLIRLWLRIRSRDQVSEIVPLNGTDAMFSSDGGVVEGEAHGLAWRWWLETGSDAWAWRVTVTNIGTEARTVDLLHSHDPALAPAGAVRTNEYYCSQYLDLTPIEVAGGVALAVRQNMPGDRVPWMVLASLTPTAGWATDARQLVPDRGLDPRLDPPGNRLQHEHALAVLATKPVELAPGQVWHGGFAGRVLADHPEPSGPADAGLVADLLAGLDGLAATQLHRVDDPVPSGTGVAALEPTAPVVAPADAEHLESGPDGSAWSWFHDGRHWVSAAKEAAVLRPHAQLVRSSASLEPDERSVTSTAWLAGSFASQIAQGHVGHGVVVTGLRSYLGLQPWHGVRILVETTDGWRLLDRPALWSIGQTDAEWRYREDVVVTSGVFEDSHGHGLRISVRAPGRVRILTEWVGDPTLDTDGLTLAGRSGRIDLRLPAGAARTVGRWLDLVCEPAPEQVLELRPQLLDDPELPAEPGRVEGAVPALTTAAAAPAELRAIAATLPWYAHDAGIHYLSPRGVEQFSGGAWGTRDVSQGPVGLLIASGASDALRRLLVRVMAGQNERGDWPQAFDFLGRHRAPGQGDSHGDVVLWPLLALADGLHATADAGLLTVEATFAGDDGPTAPAPIRDHLSRALDHLDSTLIPGTALPAYGHGDWNDSLQPADPQLAAELCSSWTVLLQAHALGRLADALTGLDVEPDLATRCRSMAEAAMADLRRLLVVDGVLAGYGRFPAGATEPVEHLVHPGDERTGLGWSLLPLAHGIAHDLFTAEEADRAADQIRDHLLGPDGARLFDRPVRYHGGRMEVFQRAETATFFGREIGIMYTHAHLRWAEALSRLGRAEDLLAALALATPVDLADRLGTAAPRQANCYYSSSDGAFADRAEADARYGDLLAGEVALEGGWRVYSSGPGLYLRLVVENLLGLRVRGDRLEVDPVLVPGADGLVATVQLGGRPVTVRFRVGPVGHGVRAVRGAGGRPLETVAAPQRYRAGGLLVELAEVGDELEVEVA